MPEPVPTMESLWSLVALNGTDPSTRDGFHSVLERSVPIVMRRESRPQAASTADTLHAKVLRGTGPQGGPPGAMRVELASDSDLFFHYAHEMDAEAYGALEEGSRLAAEFDGYCTVVTRLLMACATDSSGYRAVFTYIKPGSARLDFIVETNGSFVDLLSCGFQEMDSDTVQAHVGFRYQHTKSCLAIIQSRLVELTDMVKVSNPEILQKLQRKSNTPPPEAGPSIAPE